MKIQVNAQESQYTYSMLEHMPVGVALYDAKTNILLAANRLFRTFLHTYLPGVPVFERPVSEWLPQAESSGITNIFRTVAESGVPYRAGEYAFSGFEAGTTYWNWTLDPVYDEQGNIIQLLQTIKDITEQVQQQRELEQNHASLAKSHLLIDAERKRLQVIETVARSVRTSLDTRKISQAAITAIGLNFQAQYVYTHIADPVQRALYLLHIHPHTANEQEMSLANYIPYDSQFPVGQVYKQREPIIIEDLQAAPDQGILKSQNPLVLSGAHGYVCVPLWFGDYFEGTLTAIFTSSITQEGPEVQALIGCSSHIAAAFAHARLHTTVANERTRLRSVLDQLPEGILITEASNGAISYANEAAANILGIPARKLCGIPLHQQPLNAITYLDGQPVLPWHFTLIRSLSGETISGQETVVTQPNGKKVITLSSSAPLFSESGVITGAVVVFQDVTAQKSIEQQKKDFLSIASHELRTPITTIQGFTEILQMKVEQGYSLDSPHSLRALSNIVQQSEYLTRLIEEMLDLSRIENAQLLLSRSPHDIVDILKHVVENQATTTRQHHIHLILEGVEANQQLIGNVDEKRLAQIFSNLINNAIKYSPAHTEIEVGLCYRQDLPDEVLIWVKDHGIGIAAEDVPHIFKRFHRSSTIDRSISGLGIGLYLVKEMVTRHDGRVWVESTEGKGSTFYVQLPLNMKRHQNS